MSLEECTSARKTIYVNVEAPEPFLTVPIITAFVAAVVLVSAGLLVYFKKRKQ